MAGIDCGKKRSLESNSSVFEHDERQNKVGRLENAVQLSDFKFVKVLSEDAKSKTLILHLQDKNIKVEDQGVKDAVSIFERTPFSENMIDQILSDDVKLDLQFNNDIYSQYICKFPEEMNSVKNTLIYPANEKHLKKYSAQRAFMVAETTDIFQKITAPYLEEQQIHLQWVYNILEKQAEADRILFEDPHPENGFILLPDLKWDQKQMKNLYIMAVSHKHGIRSLRDVNEKHLALLKNILNKGTEAIEKTFGVLSSRLRVFIHYHPSYYHFHVHFTHLDYDAPGSTAGKAHLLQDVIDNIENIDKNYYIKKTLYFVLKEHSKLFSLFKEAGFVKTDTVEVELKK